MSPEKCNKLASLICDNSASDEFIIGVILNLNLVAYLKEGKWWLTTLQNDITFGPFEDRNVLVYNVNHHIAPILDVG